MAGQWWSTRWRHAMATRMDAKGMADQSRAVLFGFLLLAVPLVGIGTAAPADASPRHESPLLELGQRDVEKSTKEDQHHHAVLLDDPQQALVARLDLIRGARRTIDVQTYIFDEDDAGRVVISELLRAARAGVRVRVLVDQLSAFGSARTVARIATLHPGLELRIYNPTFNRVHPGVVKSLAGLACCFRRLNQRMHEKILVVDDEVVVAGSRNYQNEYYDWSDQQNFRDRDALVAGPVAVQAAIHFDAMWGSPLSVPAEKLRDVLPHLGDPSLRRVSDPPFEKSERVEALLDAVGKGDMARAMARQATVIDAARLVSDGRGKHDPDIRAAEISGVQQAWLDILGTAQREVLIQTPYLALSPQTVRRLREAHSLGSAPRVLVSTSSLASSDSALVYAYAHLHRRDYVRDAGVEISEYRPYPNGPVPPGEPRRMLHAKTMVVDDRIAVIGSHNFDARSDHLNIEGVLVIEGREFAGQVSASIASDTAPGNAWSLVEQTQGRGGSRMVLVDGLEPGCQPDHMQDPGRCRALGHFPEARVAPRLRARVFRRFVQMLSRLL